MAGKQIPDHFIRLRLQPIERLLHHGAVYGAIHLHKIVRLNLQRQFVNTMEQRFRQRRPQQLRRCLFVGFQPQLQRQRAGSCSALQPVN